MKERKYKASRCVQLRSRKGELNGARESSTH